MKKMFFTAMMMVTVCAGAQSVTDSAEPRPHSKVTVETVTKKTVTLTEVKDGTATLIGTTTSVEPSVEQTVIEAPSRALSEAVVVNPDMDIAQTVAAIKKQVHVLETSEDFSQQLSAAQELSQWLGQAQALIAANDQFATNEKTRLTATLEQLRKYSADIESQIQAQDDLEIQSALASIVDVMSKESLFSK
ncbi:hypothetical protein [Dichelobacter nodosus]|uniref:Uncharacterized protein n=1 Tax=Dichelobacter nodosus (strain VCS1703A) TaxID=246195 RepID=A5EXL1_DICNV|nr:hypothetical protein [Dichelobacter nodosus]ABQ13464.1 hypothetical protein DNO_1139 [Dichelobacter nodosus VCS1703A]AXM45914.1 hypothetical protein DYQ38_05455 [Dichelobacter nodosus]KNZ39081.1 hypothetical protein AKG33_04815 [Dichelobacter nodosus]TGA64633.1 hypothetical protein E5E99_05825 [Dichelobacter nodosus]